MFLGVCKREAGCLFGETGGSVLSLLKLALRPMEAKNPPPRDLVDPTGETKGDSTLKFLEERLRTPIPCAKEGYGKLGGAVIGDGRSATGLDIRSVAVYAS